MDFFEKLKAVWENVGIVQKALLFAIVATFVIATTFLVKWAGQPDLGLLYQGLESKEAGKIAAKLQERDISYKVTGGGTIYAPKNQIYQLRLDMAKDGLPTGGENGYRIFDNQKIGTSPFVQNINLKRATQEELAKSIQMIEGIETARIHIVDSQRSIFKSKKDRVTASVVLKIKNSHRLDQANIAAITHLVANSIKGLASNNVTIVDSKGNLLTKVNDELSNGGAGTVADYRERIEQQLAKKAESMLIAVLGPDRAAVRVSAIINMDKNSTITESYSPSQKVVTKEEIKSASETDPVASSDESSKATAGSKTDEVLSTEYAVGKVIEQRIILPGQIQSLTVAAFVDLSPIAASNDPNAAKAATASTEPIMTITEVEAILKNALGLKETDSLKVVEVKFNNPMAAVVADVEPEKSMDIMMIVKNSSIGLLAICGLLALKMFGGKAKSGGDLPPAEGAAKVEAVPQQAAIASPQMIRKQISTALKNNPEQVKQLFSSWVEGSM